MRSWSARLWECCSPTLNPRSTRALPQEARATRGMSHVTQQPRHPPRPGNKATLIGRIQFEPNVSGSRHCAHTATATTTHTGLRDSRAHCSRVRTACVMTRVASLHRSTDPVPTTAASLDLFSQRAIRSVSVSLLHCSKSQRRHDETVVEAVKCYAVNT